MRVLVANAGSSSLKLSVVGVPGDEVVARTELDRGTDATRHRGSDEELDAALATIGALEADAVGHRVVHGGERTSATVVDDELLREVSRLDELAPLHNVVAVAAIHELRERLPAVPHVACFDTAFHATLPPAARRYALPAEWTERLAIRRFGFHGLSVAWSVERAAALLARPVEDLQLVVAHLGSGASVTAVRGGASVATSMGMTPLEGLVMGTRSGSVDPGVLLHLLRHGIGSDELAEGLAHRAGLIGVSGRSAGMRELEAAAGDGDEQAALAIGLFVTRAAAEIAAAATALARLDALVFTGGIGENSSLARGAIAERLAILGVPSLGDERPPAAGDRLLALAPVAVAVVHAREEVVIARQVAAVTNRTDGR